MPKHVYRIGMISLKREPSSGKWTVRWWDARTKRYIRRRIPADDVAEAKSIAKDYNARVSSGKGFEFPSVRSAGELMLTSTSPCVLPVTQVDGRSLSDGRPGPIFRQLLAEWSAAVGLDIAAQARQFASR